MKKTTSLIALFLSSSLVFGAAVAGADETIIKTPFDLPGYCHMQFPEMRSDTLGWDRPMLDDASGRSVDFYGPCDHNPSGADAVLKQRSVEMRGFFGDGE
jgi:hypothetical protein